MYVGEEQFNQLRPSLSDEDAALINPAEVYGVELEGKTYYHLAELGNGDFIGIDLEGDLFKITHDPFEIIKLKGKLKDVLP